MLAFMQRILVVPNVEPWQAVESARRDMADVIRHQIVAELVTLVRAHPKLVRLRTKFYPDRVADSPAKHIPAGPVRIELEDARPIGFGGVVRHIRKRTN